MKCNICIIAIPEGEEEEKGTENLLEKVMTELSNLMREKARKVQKAQRVPIKRDSKRPTPRHIIIKMAKFKDKQNIKGSKGEDNIQGSPDKASS